MKKLQIFFAHRSVTVIMNLLKCASPEYLPSETSVHLKDISKKCTECDQFAPKLAIFKVSMPEDTIEFYHEI